MKARIVIGSNYGDEGKGTVVASYAKNSQNVLNVLTNGGAQRGHSILTKDGSITYQHFGSGTYFGADSYYSRFFILNPMQFMVEYNALIIKPKKIYRDSHCMWSTPYDSMANLIEEQQRSRCASCCMGIWNTIKRYRQTRTITFDEFVHSRNPYEYLDSIKEYYERTLSVPSSWEMTWNDRGLASHFIYDCQMMYKLTTACDLYSLTLNHSYENLIFENGQGLLLSDTGKDTPDTTPSFTGSAYAMLLLKGLPHVKEITAHYVTRPYLTRHGEGIIMSQEERKGISSSICEDRTNHYNPFQGEFRYGKLDIGNLYKRIQSDAGKIPFELEVTHCDEMDRTDEFRKWFDKVNCIDSPLV